MSLELPVVFRRAAGNPGADAPAVEVAAAEPDAADDDDEDVALPASETPADAAEATVAAAEPPGKLGRLFPTPPVALVASGNGTAARGRGEEREGSDWRGKGCRAPGERFGG